MKQVRINALLPDRVPEEWVVRYAQEPPWVVEVASAEGKTFSGMGNDLFLALQDVRRGLDQRGILLCCNGARANARPSPAFSASGAELIYLMPRRRPVSVRDIVPLFSPAPSEAAVTVREQEAAWERINAGWSRRLWFLNPVWWLRRMIELVKGPRIWTEERDSEGFVRWRPVAKGGRS